MAASRPDIKTSTDEDFLLPLERWLPEGQVLPLSFRDVFQQIQDIPVKDNDIWIVTFPKSGTTWMQETVWLLVNNLDFEAGLREELRDRSPFLELPLMRNLRNLDKDEFEAKLTAIANLPGRRVVKSHLHWDKLPRALREPQATSKIIYVARHPKDVCISYFYFNRILLLPEHKLLSRNLDEYGDKFMNDLVAYAPYWSHVFEFWKRRNDPNVCFVWYEEMKKNLSGVIKRLSEFLEVPQPTGEKMDQLVNHLSFESMKKNSSVNTFPKKDDEDENNTFFRKGEMDQWKEKMSPALVEKFDAWIKKHTENTDLEFYH